MNATNPPPPVPLADELELLLADALWAYESRQDATVLERLIAAVRAAVGDPRLSQAAALLHWGAPEDFEDEDLEWDDWAGAQVRLATALAEAVVRAERDLDARAGALDRLAELQGRTGSAAAAVATYTELAEVRARLAGTDPAGPGTLADALSRLAHACERAARTGDDDAERARLRGDAAAYQLRAAEVRAALAADDAGQVPALVTATRRAAVLVEESDGPEAAVAVSAEGLRLAERHADGMEAWRRLEYVESAIAAHCGLLQRAGRHDAALRLSQRRLDLHEQPGALYVDHERHARALRAHAHALRDAGFPEAALPVLERAVAVALAGEESAPRAVNALLLAFAYAAELREAHEALGEARAALRASERAVAIKLRHFDRDPQPYVARQYRDAAEAHQRRLAEQGLDDEPVATVDRIVAVFERLDTAGRPNTELASLLCDKLVDLDRRGLWEEALALGARELAIREAAAAATPGPHPELARARHNQGLVANRLGRRAEAEGDFAIAVELHEAVAAAAEDGGAAEAAANLADALYNHAKALWRLRRRDAAVQRAERCIALRGAVAEERPASLASALELLADIHHDRRDFDASIGVRHRAEAAYARLPESDTERPRHLAETRANLAATLVQAGRHEEALAAGHEAVAVLDAVHAQDPRKVRATLALTLRNLCIAMQHTGRLEEQLATAERALAIEEERHRDDPEADLDDLADAFDRYSLALNEIGRTAEAVAPAVRAGELADRLLEEDRDLHLSDASRILDNAASTLADAGRAEDALRLSRKALAVTRELAATDTAHGARYLAIALLNHGNRLSEHGLRDEALAVAEECVDACAVLDAAEPAMHRPLLAKAHINLGRRLNALERREEAIGATVRAVDLLAPLAAADAPDLEVLEALAIAHGNLASHYCADERFEEAAAAHHRAVDLLERRAALGHRATVLPDLRNQVSWLAFRLADLDRHAEAVARAEYALSLAREIDDPAEIRDREVDLAELLQGLAVQLADGGDRNGAFAVERRSIDLMRGVYEREPDRDERDLCGALLDWTWALGLVGRVNEQADAAAETAATVERRYGGEERVVNWHAIALDNHATAVGAVGRAAEALERQRTATAAWEARLAERDDPSRRADLAFSLWYQSRWMCETGADPHATAAVSGRAADLYREAVVDLPDQRAEAAQTAGEHAAHLAAAGDVAAAVALADEAARTMESLAAADPAKRPELAAVLRDRARVHAAAGLADALAIALRSVAVWDALAEELPRAFGFELGLALRLAAELAPDPAEAAGFAARAVALLEAAERYEPGAYTGRLAEAMSTLEQCRTRTAPRRPLPEGPEADEPKTKGLRTNRS